ncbi:MAG: DNA repair protein RadC [Victivallales bacterium]|nr:DNA repair protein RadC [Victivallales bacterium]
MREVKSKDNEKLEPHYSGHRKRLRERYFKSPDALAEYELLELLLTYSIARKDVKPIAKALIGKFGSLGDTLGANLEDLAEVEGISEYTAVLLKLVHDSASRIFSCAVREKDLLQSPSSVVEFARSKLATLKDEAFMMIFVNKKNMMESVEIIHEGTIDHVVIYPRNVVKLALKHNATGIIAVHNHPSGDCEPSSHDIKLTQTLKCAAESIEVRLLDHIIVSRSKYFSFTENGLL